MREKGQRVLVAALACGALLGVSACGGDSKRQDADEPEGTFAVDVTKAEFPRKQKLAENSDLLIKVKNTGDEAVPNLAITVDGFDYRKQDPRLADPKRPVFVVNQIPRGADTAYVNTYAFAKPLAPGKTATFRWRVTAVRPGPYKLSWKVAGGLNGKAKALNEFGDQPSGVFLGSVSRKAPTSRVAADGETVVTGGEREKKEPSAVQPSQDAELPPGESTKSP